LFPGLKDINGDDNASGLAHYFSNFHGHFTNYSAAYVSEPVYMGRLDDEASPSGLQRLYSSASDAAASSDNAFDQRLQPDLEQGSIETEFSCCRHKDNRLLFASEDRGKPKSRQADESTNVGVGLIVDVDVLAAAFLLMVMGAVYKYTQERMPSTSMMMQIWMWRRRHNSMKLKMKRWMSRRMLLWTPVAEDTRWMARA